MTTKTQYIDWKPAYRSVVDPMVAYRELERIRQANNGHLTAGIVVESARPEDSPIHAEVFRIGVKQAAEEHYKECARCMIRAIVVVDENNGQSEPVRAFVHVIDDTDENDKVSVYADMEEALADPKFRAKILDRAKRELQVFRAKYKRLQELAEVFAVIDRTA